MLIRVATDVNNDSGSVPPGADMVNVGRVSRPDTREDTRASRPRRPLLILLAIIVLMAFPVRLYLALTATMISRDGATFIWYAQRLAQDPAAEMRQQAQHPLYPAMVLAAHSTLQAVGGLFRPLAASIGALLDDPVRSWTLASMTVSLLGGLAVVLAVYTLTRLLFDRPVGLIAAVLAALAAEFCQLSADALTDMPHLTLYLFGLCAAVRAFCPRPIASGGMPEAQRSEARACSPPGCKTPGPSLETPGWSTPAMPWLFLSGVLSGLAFLMRPEGAGVAVTAAAGALLLTRRCRLPRRLIGPLMVILGAALVASPYMFVTGKLVQKKSVIQFLIPGSCQAAEPAVAGWQGLLETYCGKGKSPPSKRNLRQASVAPVGGSGGDEYALYRGLRHVRNFGSGELAWSASDGSEPLRPSTPRLRSGLVKTGRAQYCDPPGAAPPRGLKPAALCQLATAHGQLGSIPADLAKAAGLVLEHWSRALRGTLLLPAIFWLLSRRRPPAVVWLFLQRRLPVLALAWLFLRKRLPADRAAARLVFAAGSLHFMIVVMLVLRFDYTDLLSVRHTMILAGLTLPFSAVGVAAMLDLVPARRRAAAGVLILVALVAPTAPWMLEWRYAHEAYLRRAGEWIRSQQPSGAKVHTTRHRVAFYANGIHQWSPRDETLDIPRILAEARTHRPDWLVFDVQRVLRYSSSFLQDLQKAAGPGELTPVHVEEQTVKRRVQRAIVYRYRPPP